MSASHYAIVVLWIPNAGRPKPVSINDNVSLTLNGAISLFLVSIISTFLAGWPKFMDSSVKWARRAQLTVFVHFSVVSWAFLIVLFD